MNHLSDIQMTALLKKAADQRQKAIMEELSDLTSRGLLKIEVVNTSLVRSVCREGLEYQEVVKVTLMDKEYIEALERENAELRAYRNGTKRVHSND